MNLSPPPAYRHSWFEEFGRKFWRKPSAPPTDESLHVRYDQANCSRISMNVTTNTLFKSEAGNLHGEGLCSTPIKDKNIVEVEV